MTTDEHCEHYARLTRLYAEAVREGDRAAASECAFWLGFHPRESDTIIPRNYVAAFVRLRYMQARLGVYDVLMHRRPVTFQASEMN